MLVWRWSGIYLWWNWSLYLIDNFHFDIEIDITGTISTNDPLHRLHLEFGEVSTWVFRSLYFHLPVVVHSRAHTLHRDDLVLLLFQIVQVSFFHLHNHPRRPKSISTVLGRKHNHKQFLRSKDRLIGRQFRQNGELRHMLRVTRHHSDLSMLWLSLLADLRWLALF